MIVELDSDYIIGLTFCPFGVIALSFFFSNPIALSLKIMFL